MELGSSSRSLDVSVTTCLSAFGNHLLNQRQTLCNRGLPRDTTFFVPSLDGKSHAVMTICVRSHLWRIFSLLTDRRDLLFAVAPVGRMFAKNWAVSLTIHDLQPHNICHIVHGIGVLQQECNLDLM